jgi:hypothetical protein
MSTNNYAPAPAASPNAQCPGRTPILGHDFLEPQNGLLSRRPYSQCAVCGLVKWGS